MPRSRPTARRKPAQTDATTCWRRRWQARGKQANLSFFAFTATPKAKTLELFGERRRCPAGEERYVPFHLYSMRQAIEEGFILDVLANYTTYTTYYRLANAAAGRPGAAEGQGLGGAGPVRVAASDEPGAEGRDHRRALPGQTAAKIGGQAKAMVVTRSRLHAVRTSRPSTSTSTTRGTTRAAPLRVLVAFSGTVIDPEGRTWSTRRPAQRLR